MKGAAKSFAGGTLPAALRPALAGNPVTPELSEVAQAFVDLQEARHEADYDLGRTFTRREVSDLIEVADKARTAWQQLRSTPEGKTFLMAMLIHEHLRRR